MPVHWLLPSRAVSVRSATPWIMRLRGILHHRVADLTETARDRRGQRTGINRSLVGQCQGLNEHHLYLIELRFLFSRKIFTIRPSRSTPQHHAPTDDDGDEKREAIHRTTSLPIWELEVDHVLQPSVYRPHRRTACTPVYSHPSVRARTRLRPPQPSPSRRQIHTAPCSWSPLLPIARCLDAQNSVNPAGVWVDSWSPSTVQKAYTIACFAVSASTSTAPRCSPPCERGETGRRARLRISWVTVGVQVPPLAPNLTATPFGPTHHGMWKDIEA